MARRIYKYPLPAEPGECSITMPRDARVLHFGIDERRNLCVWVLVPLLGIDGEKRFGLVFTGEDLHFFNATYVGTCGLDGLIWHCFDLGWKGESVAL